MNFIKLLQHERVHDHNKQEEARRKHDETRRESETKNLIESLITRECTVRETNVVVPQRNKMNLPKLTESECPLRFLHPRAGSLLSTRSRGLTGLKYCHSSGNVGTQSQSIVSNVGSLDTRDHSALIVSE